MPSPVLCAIISLACAFTFSAAQTSCKGRCGAEYYRGYMCQCDYECLTHEECCEDYESKCTTRSSCQGRCGESFKRGRLCNCDPDCVKYNQCCPDYKAHCGGEEPINGPASITPGKPSSCQNVKDNKPKDPTLNEPAEQPNVTPATFTEGDNPDYQFIPLVTPASDTQDDLSDDLDGQIYPNLPDDPYSENGLEDPDAGHIPESTSAYEPSQTDLLEPVPTDPTLPDSQDNSELQFTTEETFTLFPETQKPPSHNKPTQANAKPSPSNPTNGEAPTESADGSDPEKQSDPTWPSESGATLPQPSPTYTAVSDVAMQPTPSLVPQTGPTPSDNTPEFQSGGQAEIQPESSGPEAQNIDPIEASSDPLEVLPTDPDNPDSKPTPSSQVPNTSPSTSASSKPGQTPITEATIPNTEPDGTNSESKDVPTITTSSPSGTQDPNASDSQTPGSENETGPTPSDNTPEFQSGGQESSGPEVQNTDPTEASSDPTQDPTASDTQTPVSENETEPSPESGARGDTPDSWNGPQNGALSTRAPSPTDQVQDDMVDGVTPGETTTEPLEVTPVPTKPRPSKPTSKPQTKPNKPSPTKPSLAKPTSQPMPKPMDTEQTLNIDNPRDYQADDSNDTNICSGRPASALTTLRNGTIVVFRGHYFWVLDRNRVPGPARGITEVWGVPSPIDTVFTRCNCQGKTYILKGEQYWRYDNDVVDPGYPKLIQTGFDGLQGQITAALSVPQYQRRRESVYFFKRGGLVQKYSYQFGTSPTCGRKVQYAVYTVRSRAARQAVSLLEPAINIRTSWRGFPTTITSAVSVPSRWSPEGYKYYVFSRSKYHNIRMNSERPVIAALQSTQTNSAKDFFNCPKKV